jgi:hypothetical protein
LTEGFAANEAEYLVTAVVQFDELGKPLSHFGIVREISVRMLADDFTGLVDDCGSGMAENRVWAFLQYVEAGFEKLGGAEVVMGRPFEELTASLSEDKIEIFGGAKVSGLTDEADSPVVSGLLLTDLGSLV